MGGLSLQIYIYFKIQFALFECQVVPSLFDKKKEYSHNSWEEILVKNLTKSSSCPAFTVKDFPAKSEFNFFTVTVVTNVQSQVSMEIKKDVIEIYLDCWTEVHRAVSSVINVGRPEYSDEYLFQFLGNTENIFLRNRKGNILESTWVL